MQSLIVLHHSWVQQDMVTKKSLGSMITLIESHGVVFEIQWIFHPLHSKNFFTYRNYHSQGLRQWAGIARGYWKIPERLANSQPLMSGGKADRGGGISQPKRNFPIPPSNACAIDIVTLRRINEVQWCALENQQSTF